MNGNRIDETLCTRCGRCVDLCPVGIFFTADDKRTDIRESRTALCITCGQCMAVCPSKAVAVPGLDYDRDFFDFTLPDDGSFFSIIERRRSIRRFRNTPVPEEKLQKIVEAVSFAPPGFTPLKTELTVVSNPDMIKKALPVMIQFYEGLLKAMKNPVARTIIRLRSGKDSFRLLTTHVVPLMTMRMPALKSGSEDTITRGAPAMLLFHTARDAENRRDDAYIALGYGLLAAQALGLGAIALSLVPPAVERNRELRIMFHIPDGNEVLASLVLGFPVHRYRRGIRRRLPRVVWVPSSANGTCAARQQYESDEGGPT